MNHPAKLGKYPITRVLGEGAMGVVYQAVDPVIQRQVAIKTVHKQLLADDDPAASFAARFRNEAQAAGRLAHPGIVAVHEYGEDAHDAYIVMEYVEGRTLARLLAATPLPGEPDILLLMDQLLDALGYAHAQGVWHRDVKPANLIVTPAGRLKITDFGIARIADAALTQATAVIGTPGYMAPEQYTGAPLDHRIDLFAAGVLLYRMLAGRAPFQGSAEAVMYQILNEEPLAPSRVEGSGRSPAYDAIVAKALAKKPEARFASAAEFRLALRSLGATPDEQTTIVLGRGAGGASGEPGLPTRPGTTPQGSASGSGSASAGGTGGWSAEALQPFETALATQLGPMAKVLVRQAARVAGDAGTLAARLAEHLGDGAEREAFLARVARTGSGARATSATAVPAPAPIAVGTLAPEVVEHATRVLATHVGPIARVLVKKAAARAANAEQLYALLVEDTASGAERDMLLKKLRGA